MAAAPSVSISKKAMLIMQSLTTDVFNTICDEARDISAHAKRQTVGARRIPTGRPGLRVRGLAAGGVPG